MYLDKVCTYTRFLLLLSAIGFSSLSAPCFAEDVLNQILKDVIEQIGGTGEQPEQPQPSNNKRWRNPNTVDSESSEDTVPVPGSVPDETDVDQSDTKSKVTNRVNALLVRDESGNILLYPFNGNSFADGKTVASDWDDIIAYTVGDWNEDGMSDILAYNQDEQLILHKLGKRFFEEGKTVGTISNFTNMFAQDWNGDGISDVMTRRDNGNLYLSIFEDGFFQDEKKIGNKWQFVDYFDGDWDNDGMADLMVRKDNGDLILYPFNGRFFDNGKKVGSRWNFANYFPSDWDGDGGLDLMVRTEEEDLIFYKFDGEFKNGKRVGVRWNFSHYLPGDWDGDGTSDMMIRTAEGDMVLYLFNGRKFGKAKKVGNGWFFTHYQPITIW